MSGRPNVFYKEHPCRVCGAMISGNGFASYNHSMKHVREGLFVRRGQSFHLTDEGQKLVQARRVKQEGATT